MAELDNTTVLELFQRNVVKSPEAIAVSCGDEKLSYAALNQFANALADELVFNGVMRDDLVAIFLPRGIDQIIAMIAIMKCGAAYLPLDIEHSNARLFSIIKDADPRLVLADMQGELQLMSQGICCFTFDKEHLLPYEKTHTGDLDTNRNRPIDALAYVIYTSGSTGTPNGVKVSHGNLASLMKSTHSLFSFSAADVWTAFHSFAFDFSVWEIWGALAFGGKLVIVPSMIARQPAAFLALLAKEKVTILNQTPSAFYGFMKEAERQSFLIQPLALRCVIFGGEALDIDRVCKFASKMQMHQTQFINMYGITEITIHASYYVIDLDKNDIQTSVIGRALPHLSIYLLDDQLNAIDKPGVEGEIYVSGLGVAQGYLNRPDLTANRFIPDPFDVSGRQMYRSGDLARYTEDCCLEYIGRSDQQVKIRGYRVELSEIEAVLKRYPSIDNAVVLFQNDLNGDHSLVAFVTMKPNQNSVEPIEIKKFIRDDLPPYMLPSQLKVVHSIPMTVNGKVDKKILLNSAEVDMTHAVSSSSMENPLEHFVISVWSKILGVKDIGPNDDFFDLGGQSLNALSVVKELGITMLELFSEPTPRAIAKIILNNIQHKKEPNPHQWLHGLNSISYGSDRLSLVCVPYGGGGPLVYQELARCLPDVNVFSVALPGHDPLSPRDLVAFEDVVSQCIQSIKKEIRGPIAIYGHCAGNALAIEIARRLESSGVSLVSVHLGAMLLNKNPENVIAQVKSNTTQDVVDFLKSLGGLNGALQHDSLDDLIAVFKHDSLQAAEFFINQKDPTQKIHAPVHIIIGGQDPVTVGYPVHYLDWGKFAHHLSLSVIPSGGHYFVKYQTQALAQLIQEHCLEFEPQAA